MADRIGGMAPQARGHSPEQNPINVFLVHECKMVPQHKSCIRMVLTPKIRLDSNETARLATTTRALPIPESGPSISNQTLLIFRKTVHDCRHTSIAFWATIIEVDATYEHTGAGPMDTQSLRFGVSREKGPRLFWGLGFAGRQCVGPANPSCLGLTTEIIGARFWLSDNLSRHAGSPRPDRRSRPVAGQFSDTAFFTSAAILASSAAVNPFSA